ncbi:50S ribosomal protein L5 [Candidatus Legionella polyplacis]|uniref:Large ribosomal subunit protein uL5 n=1 Tax=Candidatus Legionella polyplacis TaxID=2005262 RepID=A0ABZ2H0P5_9GAMM|nr:50S ribosomal protein L5 [Candidatus Legionella polyplacis]ATW01755.1 50S ribosomal protein L5 [Candidatus Legionella polyplacis]
MSRLRDFYNKEIIKKMMDVFSYKSIMEVPRILKITLNMGVGKSVDDKKILQHAIKDMILISGQKPFITKAKKSLANFKIRKNFEIGCKVTLRRDRMYDFLDKIINIVLPRVRDFRGLSRKSFDGTGNYNFGIKEQIVFPEIDFDKIDRIRGLDVSIVTNACTDKEAAFLLESFDFPLVKMYNI